MSDPKPFASLGPSLLARKGAARPAMRPQLQPMHTFHEATARQIEDDLGWNDMGHGFESESPEPAPQQLASVVPIAPGVENAAMPVPEVVRQQEAIAEKVIAPARRAVAPKPRRSALAEGRRAAFTLRLDAERHLKLRLASALAGRSAQQLVTDALDKLIATLPDVDSLAAQVRKRH